jgi:hypothetical protein
MNNTENQLILKDIFLCLDEHFRGKQNPYLDIVRQNFAGIVVETIEQLDTVQFDVSRNIYLSGFITQFFSLDSIKNNIKRYKNIYIVTDFILFEDSDNENPVFDLAKLESEYPEISIKCVSHGMVPLNIYGIGIQIRECYDNSVDWFGQISTVHQFQNLTEGNKSGVAYRTGIYITPVKQVGTELEFFLLRCSSNFTGGTDNFADVDKQVVQKAQDIGNHFFEQKVELNHVLAQIYWNKTEDNHSDSSEDGENYIKNHHKDKKAVIKAHSDKTKDMPRNALMGFATFYQDYNNRRFEHLEQFGVRRSTSKENPFDFIYKNASVLTVLRFVLKSEAVNDAQYADLPRKFDVTLYPNSLFMMSLTGNRLYTHEIVPSGLPVSLLPIRMGYVIRCSKTKAIHKEGKTFMIVGDDCVEMTEMSQQQRQDMRHLYAEENGTINMVEYPLVFASMNQGDYMPPNLNMFDKSDV